MKIALACKHFDPKKGGMERYTVNLARGLRERGHQVTVFANSWVPEPGLAFHPVYIFPISSPGKNLSFALCCARAIKAQNYDVVQSMDRIWYQDIYRVSDGISPVHLAQRETSPLLQKVRGLGPRRQALAYLERRIFEKGGCRKVIANSCLVKSQICQYYQVDPERIRVIYNSVDLSRFHPGVQPRARQSRRELLGIPDHELVLLFAANDFKRKDLTLVLKALAALNHPGVRLWVAGSDESGPYAKRAAALGLRSQVDFLGRQTEMERLYGAADGLVLPSRYDAFANVCLEAMACGLPVITSPWNGAAELICQGENGFVLSSADPEELAARIRELLPPDRRAQMGEHAAQLARTFGPERHISQVLALYQRMGAAA